MLRTLTSTYILAKTLVLCCYTFFVTYNPVLRKILIAEYSNDVKNNKMKKKLMRIGKHFEDKNSFEMKIISYNGCISQRESLLRMTVMF